MSERSRSVARRAGTVVVLGLLGATVLLWPGAPQVRLDRGMLPADGRATARAYVARPSLSGLWWRSSAPLTVEADASLGTHVLRAHDGTQVLRAGTRAGVVRFVTSGATAELRLLDDPRDLDQDGLPDAMELLGQEDRAAFTVWFTALAEAQATRLDDAWAPVHQDCAGLVRFALREALKAHDAAWLERRRYLPTISAPDVQAVRYPALPFAGDRPFRAVGGAFDPAVPAEVQFTAAASARALWQLNTRLVSREVSEARPGDLLFFSVPHAPGSGLHTMIVLGARPGATPDEPATRVVYHTGRDGEAHHGEVRVVSLADLSRHPDVGWHPLAHNARFLGVHRLNLLDHEARVLARLEPLDTP